MTQAAFAHASAHPTAPVCTPDQASSFTPAEIRQAIAHWVGQDRMDMAQALVAAGLAIHPDSEDVLAIAALVAEMSQDWAVAQDCLEQLLALQGLAATPEIHYHLVRVMRCRAAHHGALGVARRGLSAHPEHLGLQREQVELTTLLESVPVVVNAQAQLG